MQILDLVALIQAVDSTSTSTKLLLGIVALGVIVTGAYLLVSSTK